MLRFVLTLLLALAVLSGCTQLPATQLPPTPTPAGPTPAGPDPGPTPAPTQSAGDPGPGPTPEATFPPPPSASSGWLAYAGSDGNIWLYDLAMRTGMPITSDGAAAQPNLNNATILYTNPQWSGDGRYLAFQREAATPTDSGLNLRYGLWVYDLDTKTLRPLLDNQSVAGFAWQPGTHTLAFGLPVANNYFGRSGVDTSLAQGIWSLDAAVEGVAPSQLVAPQNGLHLAQPQWSPDGRFLSFDEIAIMEGRGNFAYVDLASGQYTAAGGPIGFYAWSADGESLYYDQLNYTPSGSERIWRIARANLTAGSLTGAEQVSPHQEAGYAFLGQDNRALSPSGDQIAYLAQEGAPDQPYTVYVQALQPGSSPQAVFTTQTIYSFTWAADGQHLLVSAGQPTAEEVVLISLGGSAPETIAMGRQPAFRPE